MVGISTRRCVYSIQIRIRIEYVNKVNCIRNFILFACIYETIFHKLRALLLLLTFYNLLVGIHIEPFLKG